LSIILAVFSTVNYHQISNSPKPTKYSATKSNFITGWCNTVVIESIFSESGVINNPNKGLGLLKNRELSPVKIKPSPSLTAACHIAIGTRSQEPVMILSPQLPT
jgi:hypothetical protein